MHRSKMNLLILLALIMFAFVFAGAQTSGSASLFLKPERLVLNGIGEPDPDVEEPDENVVPMTESFYPIGWSRDGKFAYFVEPPDEACGCYFAEIVIQDLKTDKVLWKERYNSSDLPNPEAENLDSLWPKKQKEYSAKLNEHGIQPISEAKLLHPSINFNGDVLTPKLDIRIETDHGFMVNGTVTLKMISNKRGSKTIRRDVYKRKDTNGFRDAEISGSLKSPFESRVAVIVVEVMRGYEGPPNVTSIKISGSTLTTGFKK